MPLSQRYTLLEAFNEARIDTGLSINSSVYVRRQSIHNASQDAIFNITQGLTVPSFMRAFAINGFVIGKKSAAGAFTASTKRMIATMLPAGFTSFDVDKLIIVSKGNSVYSAFIDSYISPTQVSLRGILLPVVDTAFDDVRLPNSKPDVDQIQLGQVRLNRLLAPIHMVLESTATKYVKAVSLDDLRVWDETNNENQESIVFALEGSVLYLKKGNQVDDYGTMVLHAPCTPEPCTSDTMKCDLPDGLIMQMHIVNMRLSILRQMHKQVPDVSPLLPMLQTVYQQMGQEISTEELAQKTKALL